MRTMNPGPGVYPDEVRNVKLPRSGPLPVASAYDASEVDDLLDRIAAELDAGRAAGPLIANAVFRMRSRGYATGATDWLLEQLRCRVDPSEVARMNADPWRDLGAEPHCIRREPGGLGVRVAVPSLEEYADAWRDFDRQPGTRLWLVPTGAMRRELRTAEQQTVATVRYGLLLPATLSAGGRTFTLKEVTRSSWRGIAGTISREQPNAPAHSRRRHADEKDVYLHQLLDETGTPVLYRAAAHIGRSDGGYIKFPGHQWLRFPVQGTTRADAIMTAVDKAGNKLARYRLARSQTSRLRKRVEITVHPGQQLTGELALALTLSAPWLRSYFRPEGGGGG